MNLYTVPSNNNKQVNHQANKQANKQANNNSNNASASSLGNVRIHPTEMQLNLQGLMNSKNNQIPSYQSKNDNSNDIAMLQHLKSSLANGDVMRDVMRPSNDMINKPSFAKNETTSGDADPNPNDPFSKKNDDAGNPNGKSSRQKNDKAVEVKHDQKVIARFRTQTECARYLRATPEAVSYHCSKGGGVCNGLVIQPLSAQEVGRLVELQSLQQLSSSCGDPTRKLQQQQQFGLFEGAVQFRPKERPQLKPETVAILKKWLLSPDHMDNPYPNQRESEMLMEKTGLDKTQLKHWFNNARKRILKPLLKNGGKKPPTPPKKNSQGGAKGGQKRTIKKERVSGSATGGPRKKRRTWTDDVGGASSLVAAASNTTQVYNNDASSSEFVLPKSSLCRTINSASSNDTNKMSNMTSSSQHQRQRGYQQNDERRLFEQRQQQLLLEERLRVRPRQFDDPFLDNNLGRGDSDGSNMNNGFNTVNKNDRMAVNRYEQLMGYNSNGMSQPGGIGRGDIGGMMSFGDMRGMRNDTSGNSFTFNDGFGGMGGRFQGRGNNGMGGGGFNRCMETSDSGNPFDRFSDYPPSRMNSNNNGNGIRHGFHQDRFNQDRFSQDSNQDGYGNNTCGGDDDTPYCQPLNSSQGGQGPREIPPSITAMGSDDSARSNAVFKQQVATMAMNEASTAFKDMEDAFAHAKGILAAARTKRRGGFGVGDAEDDPMVFEANARAKKCQRVAMFKLKVSQRASEEAANAYDNYQRTVEEMGGGGGVIGGNSMERGMERSMERGLWG
mmetsp:Transcript_38976/g.81550  ORF Transcript_38976/g.81550 Transcript_38976/m.81550 type:complete len:780 (-) Transcript_38976:142-2481(-)